MSAFRSAATGTGTVTRTTRTHTDTHIQIRQAHCRRERGPHMLPFARIPVTTRANLVVEGAVHLVLFRAVNAREKVGHD